MYENNKDAIIEVIINNGITKDGMFMWMKPEDSLCNQHQFEWFYNVTNALIQKLLVNKYGRVINMVSVSGLKGTPGQKSKLFRCKRSGYRAKSFGAGSCKTEHYCKRSGSGIYKAI